MRLNALCIYTQVGETLIKSKKAPKNSSENFCVKHDPLEHVDNILFDKPENQLFFLAMKPGFIYPFPSNNEFIYLYKTDSTIYAISSPLSLDLEHNDPAVTGLLINMKYIHTRPGIKDTLTDIMKDVMKYAYNDIVFGKIGKLHTTIDATKDNLFKAMQTLIDLREPLDSLKRKSVQLKIDAGVHFDQAKEMNSSKCCRR